VLFCQEIDNSNYAHFSFQSRDMEDLLEHLVRWDLHPEVMVTHRFPIEQAKQAYELFDSGKTGKVAIVWEEFR
jgi:threonine dehydrogenase-like Zn-dependent dehydrogenase